MDELSSHDRRSPQYYFQGDQRAKNHGNISYSTLPKKEYEDQSARSYVIDDNDDAILFPKKIKEVPILNNFFRSIIEK